MMRPCEGTTRRRYPTPRPPPPTRARPTVDVASFGASDKKAVDIKVVEHDRRRMRPDEWAAAAMRMAVLALLLNFCELVVIDFENSVDDVMAAQSLSHIHGRARPPRTQPEAARPPPTPLGPLTALPTGHATGHANHAAPWTAPRRDPSAPRRDPSRRNGHGSPRSSWWTRSWPS